MYITLKGKRVRPKFASVLTKATTRAMKMKAMKKRYNTEMKAVTIPW